MGKKVDFNPNYVGLYHCFLVIFSFSLYQGKNLITRIIFYEEVVQLYIMSQLPGNTGKKLVLG